MTRGKMTLAPSPPKAAMAPARVAVVTLSPYRSPPVKPVPAGRLKASTSLKSRHSNARSPDETWPSQQLFTHFILRERERERDRDLVFVPKRAFEGVVEKKSAIERIRRASFSKERNADLAVSVAVELLQRVAFHLAPVDGDVAEVRETLEHDEAGACARGL